MKNIIILCNANSCRSQIAEAYFQRFGGNSVHVVSAGIEPKGINPFTIKVLEEDGIDMSSKQSKNVTEYLGESFDYIITVCDKANETCPFFPGKGERIHHSFRDPDRKYETEDEKLRTFREVRDEIKEFSEIFISNLSK